MNSAAKQMQAKLVGIGLPHKSIKCYGSQIVVTSQCKDTASKWASLLSRFASRISVIETFDEAKENKGGNLNSTKVRVFRTYATI